MDADLRLQVGGRRERRGRRRRRRGGLMGTNKANNFKKFKFKEGIETVASLRPVPPCI
jgi:hypothetical protein